MGACLARLCTEIGRHLHTEVDSSKASGAAGKSELVNLGDDEGNEEETLMKITIDGEMSAPTIQVSNENQTVLGHGLAVVDCAVNSSTQNDTSYWEWHIEESMNGSALEVEGGGDNDNCLMFGVSTKRNQNFYEILSNSAGMCRKSLNIFSIECYHFSCFSFFHNKHNTYLTCVPIIEN